MSDYLIPSQPAQAEIIIKKSRFIALIEHAPSPEVAHAFIQAIRQRYPDAGHVCYAFIAGEPGCTPHVGFSDDGEPNGTAGMPMLNVLQHGEIGELVIAVVRYFGGIKLGTGGLARAYSSAVNAVLDEVQTQKRIAKLTLTFTCDFAFEAAVRRVLEQGACTALEMQYSEHLVVCCELPEDQFEFVTQRLRDLSKGQIQPKKIA